MLRMIISFLTFFFFAFSLFSASSAFATSNILFMDNFDGGEFNNWQILGGNWKINEIGGSYMLGTRVNTQHTAVEAIAGEEDWDNYIYEVDMIALQGADKNVLFRVKGNNDKYGIHMRSKNGDVSSLICIERWSSKGGNVPSFWDECDESWDFVNNKLYHLKVIALNNNIKFYVDDVLAIDFTDKVAPVDKGKVGLRVGTGAVAPTEVYFDNIRVTPIRDPVVIVPGHGASINFGEMFLKIRYPDIYTPVYLEEFPFPWHMMPGVEIYNPLIAALESVGYKKDENLFIFNYNWLEKIRSENDDKGSAEKLADFLNDKLVEGQKADVIAHSMGGLVARTCLQQVDNCPIDQLITVGTPHEGVVDTYGAWEGGEVWRTGLSKFAFSLVLHFARQEGESLYQTVQRLAPSTEEMLPTFSYLYPEDENEPLPYSSASLAYPQNMLLNQLPPPENLEENLKLIYGEGKETLSGVKIKERPWYDQILGKWPHGKPVEKKYSPEGDGTVLVQSARPFESSSGNVAGFSFDHGEIINKNEALRKIFSFLDLPAPAADAGVLFEENATDYLAFYLLSPAYLEINLTGIPAKDIFIGQEEPGRPKLIIIANPPPNWEKEVVVKGVDEDNGEYVLGVLLVRGEQTNWQEYHGEIKLNEEDHFLFEFSDEINLQLKEIKDRKSQDPDQEMLNQLQTSFSSSSFLAEKLKRLEILMKISPVEALKYAYRIKNLVALEAKEKGTSLGDLNQMNKKLDQLIVYLEAAAENEEEIYSEGKAALAYQETKTLLEELEPLSPLSDNLFVVPAAQSLTLAEESLPVSLPKNWGELIRLGRGYFLGINSKILLN